MLRKLETSTALRSVTRVLLLHMIRKRFFGCLTANRLDISQLMQSYLHSGRGHAHLLEIVKFVEVFLRENGCDWDLFKEYGEAWRWFSAGNAIGFDSLAIENIAFCIL